MMTRGILALFLLSVLLIATSKVGAQDVEVSLSHLRTGPGRFLLNHSHPDPLGAFRFQCTSGVVQLQGFELTGAGTGDFGKDLKPSTGVQAWLDDGDGEFSEINDQLLASAPGALVVSLGLGVALDIGQGAPSGSFVDTWIVIDIDMLSGQGEHDRTYSFAIADPGDVSSTATNVVFGSPPPTTPPIAVYPGARMKGLDTLPCVASPMSGRIAIPQLLPLAALIVARTLRKRRTRKHGAPCA